MTQYKFTVTGKSKSDGKNYKSECVCKNMSKHELNNFIKEQDFEEKTVKYTKEKLK